MNILNIFQIFKDKIDKRNAKRTQTEAYLQIVRDYILEKRIPHVPVKDMFIELTKKKKVCFTYQYFNKLIQSNWNVILNEEDGKNYLIVSSEFNRLCEW